MLVLGSVSMDLAIFRTCNHASNGQAMSAMLPYACGGSRMWCRYTLAATICQAIYIQQMKGCNLKESHFAGVFGRGCYTRSLGDKN